MTLRERLMTVLRGGKVDCIPLTIYKWLLPDTPAGKRLHAQGLIPIDSCRIYQEKLQDVTIDQKEIAGHGNKQVITRLRTPVGELTERTAVDPTYGSRWVQEHFVKSLEDYKVLKYVYDHTMTEPALEDFLSADKNMGENGIVLGEILPIPVQWLLVELMGTEAWCEGVMLYTDEFEELLESLTRNYKRQVEIAANSPAEVVWFPDNVTGTIMSPRLFNKYCKPIYDYACNVLRQAEKLSFAHYDGANKPIKDCNAVEIDVGVIKLAVPEMCVEHFALATEALLGRQCVAFIARHAKKLLAVLQRPGVPGMVNARRPFHPLGTPVDPVGAFPDTQAGRLPHYPFRGLLDVHSRYGLHAR